MWGSSEIPDDLLAAFWCYEQAILDDDLDVLDDFFADAPTTMRGDAAGLLVGHEAISAFRSVRGGVPSRRIERIEYRPLSEDAALLVSISRYTSGGTGLQTQLWQKTDGRWLVTVAHVTPRAQPLDRSVWRNVGDPFWHPQADGPLSGFTVAVKDLFAIQGRRIGAGNPTYLSEAKPEATTAPAVADLLDPARDDLRSTAWAVLELGGDVTAAAGRLHLHRTTLYYRLDRIRDITGVDLRDPAGRADLHAALRLAAYRSA